MENEIFNLNNKIYSNNNNILLSIINELQQIMNYSNDNIMIKRISDIIIKMNFIINDNKKNTELIIKHINNLQNQMIQNFNKLQNNNKQEIKYNDGKYIGQVINGIREGKGIFYWNDGDRYEGEWKNDKREGKGIYYYNNGNRRMGDYHDNKQIGKHVILTKSGEVKTYNY